MPTIEVTTEKNHPVINNMGKETVDLFHQRLEGKVAIITGGAHGIGKATVRLFDKHGAKVIIADIDDVAGESLSASLNSTAFIRCDVTRESDIEHVIQSAISRHGRLDILCNIAGILGRQTACRRTIMELDADEFDRVMRVNVRGAALGMKHAARAMVAAGTGGRIVSMASVAGVLGGMGPHAYTASKHAVVGLTKNAACELGAHGVRVNCISPFGVATRMLIDAWKEEEGEEDREYSGNIPSEEEVRKSEEFVRSLANLKAATLTAEDVAEAALYLVSDESKYVSGHNLVVDGGVTTSRNLIGL